MLKKAVVTMVAMEFFSFLAFLYPVLILPLLGGFGMIVLWLTVRNPELGIYILFGELFFGSRGHLLEYNVGPVAISLRLVVFVLVLGGWLLNRIKKQELRIKDIFWEPPKIYWGLLIVIGIGIISGIINKNGWANIFLDANGYLYLVALPVVLGIVKTQERIKNIFQILGAAIIVIAAKTLLLFVWFAYALPGVASLYHWVLDQDIGEITGILGSASRIFMQSQFYALPGLLIWGIGEIEGVKRKTRWLVVAAALLAIIISLSRSFWLGLFFGGLFAFFAMLFALRINFGKILKAGTIIVLIALLELGGLYLLTKTAGGGFSQAVSSRGGNPVTEAASGARLLLLPQLLEGIKSAPVFGKGFGEVVTYKSYLPDRITPANPEGAITNFAFEWGYLDMWLKIGAVGVIVYLLFIARIFREGWKLLQASDFRSQSSEVRSQITDDQLSEIRVPSSDFRVPQSGIILGMLAGIVALATLNITTPYLNHPLGIGYLIFTLMVFRVAAISPIPIGIGTSSSNPEEDYKE